MADAAKLEVSIRNILAPLLREDGFAGSGRTFRRVKGEFVQVVNVQASRRGGQFAVNLGLQPMALPDIRGEPPDPRKITESLCEFRRRLSDRDADQWWAHDPSQSSMDPAWPGASEVYVSVGRELLERVSAPDSPFLTIAPEQFKANAAALLGFHATLARTALALARLRTVQGRRTEAQSFAEIGLANVGASAYLRDEFEAIKNAA